MSFLSPFFVNKKLTNLPYNLFEKNQTKTYTEKTHQIFILTLKFIFSTSFVFEIQQISI